MTIPQKRPSVTLDALAREWLTEATIEEIESLPIRVVEAHHSTQPNGTLPPKTALLADALKRFSIPEMDELVDTLGVDYETIAQRQDGKRAYFAEVIRYFQRRDRLDEFLTACQKERPKIDWFIHRD